VQCDAAFTPSLNDRQVVLQVPIRVRREEVDELQIEKTHVAVDEAAVPEREVSRFSTARRKCHVFSQRDGGVAHSSNMLDRLHP
jgi:hypothetical protein